MRRDEYRDLAIGEKVEVSSIRCRDCGRIGVVENKANNLLCVDFQDGLPKEWRSYYVFKRTGKIKGFMTPIIKKTDGEKSIETLCNKLDDVLVELRKLNNKLDESKTEPPRSKPAPKKHYRDAITFDGYIAAMSFAHKIVGKLKEFGRLDVCDIYSLAGKDIERSPFNISHGWEIESADISRWKVVKYSKDPNKWIVKWPKYKELEEIR